MQQLGRGHAGDPAGAMLELLPLEICKFPWALLWCAQWPINGNSFALKVFIGKILYVSLAT